LEALENWETRVRTRPSSPDLVEGILPDSTDYMLIAGRAGIGKSIIALQLAFCLATGTPFLSFSCQKVKVGYLSFEGSDQKLLERVEKIKTNFPPTGRNLFVHVGDIFKLARQPQKFIWAVKGLRVLIIDPLRYMVEHDYCKPEYASNFISNLQLLSQQQNVACIIVHHIRKPDRRHLIEPGDLDNIKGATDYVDAATTVLLLERSRQSRSGGKFAPVVPDEKTLYFAKTRDAIADIPPKTLILNRSKLIFEEPAWSFKRRV